MKVLTSDAVQDPTRVEARVRREVAMRKHQHEKMNTERKLDDEQRKEKVENKKLEEEKKGIYGAVFKCVLMRLPRNATLLTAKLGSKHCRTLRIGSRSGRMLSRGISLASAYLTRLSVWYTLKERRSSYASIGG